MENSSELRYFDPYLYSTIVLGPLLFFLVENVFSPFIFEPFSVWVMGVSDLKLEKGTRLHSKVKEYFPHLIMKVIMNFTEMVLWMDWLSRFRGWENWREWPTYCLPLPLDHEEYIPARRIYYIYFVFVIFVTLKDMWRRPANAGLAQYTFDMHHFLALGLTGASLSTGCWRGGVLTRASHGITDVVLYGAKCVETYIDVQEMLDDRQSKSYFNIKATLLVVTCIAWFVTRIVIYGVVCYSYTLLYQLLLGSRYITIMGFMLAGSWAMYILQVLWLYGIFTTVQKFFSTGGDIVDANHAHHGKLEEEKTKKTD